MKALGFGTLAAITAVAMLGVPGSLAECIVTSAPEDTLSLNLPGNPSGFDYAEERELCAASSTPDKARGEGCGYSVAPPAMPPPVQWGRQFGEGTWLYEESNGLPGLQAGGLSMPICLGENVCVLGGEQIEDETCGAGSDLLLGSMP